MLVFVSWCRVRGGLGGGAGGQPLSYQDKQCGLFPALSKCHCDIGATKAVSVRSDSCAQNKPDPFGCGGMCVCVCVMVVDICALLVDYRVCFEGACCPRVDIPARDKDKAEKKRCLDQCSSSGVSAHLFRERQPVVVVIYVTRFTKSN